MHKLLNVHITKLIYKAWLEEVRGTSADRFLRDEGGATVIEYAVLIGLLAVVIMAPISLLGSTTGEAFGTVNVGFAGTEASGVPGGSLSGMPGAGSGQTCGSGTGTGFM
jgi:pilus assembly protein Flp/PilA